MRASNYRQEEWRNVFDITFQNTAYKDVEVALIGKHNALNALAVFGLALFSGVKEEQIRQAFRTFAGTKRRAERKWCDRGILFLDDYAHHPTEIRTTLAGIRSAIGDMKLIAVYQPHRYTRIRDCLGTFGGIFDEADEVVITDLFSAGEPPIESISHVPILNEIKHPSLCYVPRNELAAYLSAKSGVIVTLGAGDITRLSKEVSDYYETSLK